MFRIIVYYILLVKAVRLLESPFPFECFASLSPIHKRDCFFDKRVTFVVPGEKSPYVVKHIVLVSPGTMKMNYP